MRSHSFTCGILNTPKKMLAYGYSRPKHLLYNQDYIITHTQLYNPIQHTRTIACIYIYFIPLNNLIKFFSHIINMNGDPLIIFLLWKWISFYLLLNYINRYNSFVNSRNNQLWNKKNAKQTRSSPMNSSFDLIIKNI